MTENAFGIIINTLKGAAGTFLYILKGTANASRFRAHTNRSRGSAFTGRERDKIRLKHYSIRTEQAYIDWVKRYILFHKKCHPSEMGALKVEQFLTHLAVKGKVAASTQNQAKSALLFLYREVLEIELPWLDDVAKAKDAKRIPVVLTVQETQH